MSFEEKIAGEFNHFLKIMNHKERGKPDESLSEDEKRHSISLMRVNASGEVAAQALYRGQAFFAKSKKVKKHLLKAGEEEFRHLKWCDKRLKELGGRKSLLDPFYYAGSVWAL